MKTSTYSRVAYQRGVGLIEVLVALLVLAIGLLGLLVMQTRGVQLTQASYHQSQAIFLAEDILERIRANVAMIESYEIDFDDDGGDDDELCDSTDEPCSQAELAAADLISWKSALAQLLPGGDGAVSVANPSGNLYPVSVQVSYGQGDVTTYRLETTL